MRDFAEHGDETDELLVVDRVRAWAGGSAADCFYNVEHLVFFKK